MGSRILTSTSRAFRHKPISFLPSRSFSTSISPDWGDSQTVNLRDSRVLGVAQFGSPVGTPILCFHGAPSSRLEYADSDQSAKDLGVRLICLDRPGMGLSTFYPDRKVLDWPSDVSQLIEQFQLDKYYVLATSGGTAYGLACAKMLPRDALRGVGILYGVGPPETGTKGMSIWAKLAWNTIMRSPSLLRVVYDKTLTPAAQNPDREVFTKIVAKQLRGLKDKDRAICERPEIFPVMVEMFREALRQGAKGYAEEIRLVRSNWGFRLEDIEYEGIRLWYGTEDLNTPLNHGQYMAARLKKSVLKEYPGETHFTLGTNYWEEILKDLLSTK